MIRFQDVQKLSLDIECEPFIWRIGCFQCIRTLGQKLPTPDDLNRSHVTGAATNVNCEDLSHSWFIQACLLRPETYGQEVGWGFGKKFAVSPYMAHGELVKTFLVAALGYGEHEVREAFKYRGRRIFGPHIDVEELWEIAENTEVRDASPPSS